MTAGRGKKTTRSWSSEDKGTGTPESLRLAPARPWALYLLAVPAFAAIALLAVLFFAAFLALSVLAAGGLGLWLWWVRRKLGRSAHARTLDGEYVVIEETQIIEKKKDGSEYE